jgi:hypothetical protein
VLKTILIILAVVIVVVIIALVVLAVAAGRFGRRAYQRYSGLEHQRAAAKRSRDAGVDRLKDAERGLVQAQRELIARGKTADAQTVERLRLRLTTATDRHRYALHGYAPLRDPNPIQEAELAELQARDADAIEDAQLIKELASGASSAAAEGKALDLSSLEAAVDHFVASLDQRKAMS